MFADENGREAQDRGRGSTTMPLVPPGAASPAPFSRNPGTGNGQKRTHAAGRGDSPAAGTRPAPPDGMPPMVEQNRAFPPHYRCRTTDPLP